MDDRLLLLNLSRILSGYFIFLYEGERWKLEYPSMDVKYEADLLAQIEYDKLKFSGWHTLDSIVHLMVEQGMWKYELDQKLEQTERVIENLKVDLYKNFMNPAAAKKIRKDLKREDNAYNRLYAQRHAYDYLTIEGFCSDIKNDFILSRGLTKGEDTVPYFLQHDDHRLLCSLSSFLAKNSITMTDYRQIGRSNQWLHYAGNNRDHLFQKPIVDWTDEQRTLMSITRMYESAREHPDCPSDNIFEDDDAFDGWAISERRKVEKERSKNKADMLPGKLDNASEVFVMANSRQEASQIYNMNDHQASSIIKERNSVIKNAKTQLDEQQLPDIQRDLIIESNQKRSQSTRNR